MKSLPITHRAKNSPLKEADAFLVKNDAQTNKEFVDVRKTFATGREEGKSQTKAKVSQREATTGKPGGSSIPALDQKSITTATSTVTPVPTK